MKKLFLVLALVLPSQAMSQSQSKCAPREIVSEVLATKYKEKLQSVGISEAGNLIEVWANIKTGSFTIISTSPQGVSCFKVGGKGFLLAIPEPEGTLN